MVDEAIRPEVVRELTPEDRETLRVARRRLEVPSLAARATAVLGTPIEKGLEQLPAGWQSQIQKATHAALERGLDVALRTLERPASEAPAAPAVGLHRLAAGLSGAAGGAFGLVALPIELPISMVVMLRGIADVARAEGEDLGAIEARLACLEVFAFGGSARSDDAAETGYFAVRSALGKVVSDAAAHLARRGLAQESAPPLLRLIVALAERFGVVVAEKAAASLVPVIGALGGAAINVVFIDHFTEIARGHFCVRRLERKYGAPSVRLAYREL